jgi:hypothetical protein
MIHNNYKKGYFCATCFKWIKKGVEVRNKNNTPMCPTCNNFLRTRARNLKYQTLEPKRY